jgi:hypothetical protein
MKSESSVSGLQGVGVTEKNTYEYVSDSISVERCEHSSEKIPLKPINIQLRTYQRGNGLFIKHCAYTSSRAIL